MGKGHHAGRWTLLSAAGFVVVVAIVWAVRYLLRRRKPRAETAVEIN
jgi:hypothetical protein